MSRDAPAGAVLAAPWRAAWPQALTAWSRYTRIRDPLLCTSSAAAAAEGLQGGFAMIRLRDQSVVIDLEAVHTLGLGGYAVEILAHEIGHHVLAPGSAAEQFRLLAVMNDVLSTLHVHSAMVANLYTDLLINDRLQREAGLRIADVFRALGGAGSAPAGAVWALYMRIYEHLWDLAPGSLGHASTIEGLDGDAWLGARVIRVYASEPMTGAGRFATLLLPYLLMDTEAKQLPGQRTTSWLDTRDAVAGCTLDNAYDALADHASEGVHPAYDARITGLDDEAGDEESADDAIVIVAAGQAHDPFVPGETVHTEGLPLTDHELAMRRYRELALPHLVPFPARPAPQTPEPQVEAVEPWELGAPLDEIDWLASVLVSPVPIPGVTLMRRAIAAEPARTGVGVPVPVDLDMYVDSSASMPNPQKALSFLALAGAVIALSALRAGAAVQVTLWSGKHDVLRTRDFVTDENDILRVLTGFFGNMTDFPIHRLRDTYLEKPARPTHILMISDDGISTMFDQDERGNSGWDVAARALGAAGAGGTMALNLRKNWEAKQHWWNGHAAIARARDEQGWEVHAIERMDDLLAFARAFSLRHYGAARHG
jgi:hypothetical protein